MVFEKGNQMIYQIFTAKLAQICDRVKGCDVALVVVSYKIIDHH